MECQNDLTGCRLSADTVATRYEYEDQLHYTLFDVCRAIELMRTSHD